ncbi:ABC transporter permease [Candidatus Woesearchaeota archaeon]|nr:ABC transporter permease [Candidatus Woesearchaeota archaeon]
MAGKIVSMLRDYFFIAVKGMRNRKLRSWLTMLGIFIGIAAVVALISVSRGMQAAITEQFSSVGADRIIVQPGSAFFGPPGSTAGLSKITKHDLGIVEKARGVKGARGVVLKTSRLEFSGKTKFVLGFGIPADAGREILGSRFDVSEGRQFREGDRNSKVAIVGNSYSSDDGIVGKKIGVGDKIKVEGEEFRVVGVRKRLGDPENDVAIVIPLETAWNIYGNKDEFNFVTAIVEEGFSPSDVAAKVEDAIRKDRKQEEGNEDFQVQTSEELFASFTAILGIIQAVIIGIAAISLVVGSIGVMNTMYTAVLERTREIGIMKSVGATNRDVLLLFLVESGLYGLVGGLVGIAFGLGMAKTIEFAATEYLGSELLQASTSPLLILGALAFSFTLGCLSGAAPARQAARLNPVQALRYE